MIETDTLRKKVVDLAVRGLLTSEYKCEINAKDELSALMGKTFKELNEVPFPIKDGWFWVTVEELGADVKNPFADGPFGSNLKREHYTTEKQVRIIQLSNVGELGWRNENEKYTTYEHLETIKRSEVEAGNIVIAKMMPAGRAIIVPEVSEKYVLSSDCVKFVPFEKLNTRYLCYAINSQMFRQQVLQDVHGIGRERTSLSKLKSYLLPIPPIEEQQVIVDKIDEVFSIIEKIDLLQEEYSENFTMLRGKIIDAGIKGELSEQLEGDGTAEELFKEIDAERKQLEEEGIIKKVDLFPAVSEEEKPYSIPENWLWTRFGNTSYIVRGGSPRPIKQYITDADDGINWIKIGDVEKGGKYIYGTKEKIIPEGEKKSRRVYPGDFLLTNSMSFGRPYISKIEGCIHDGWLLIRNLNGFDADYLYYLLSSTYLYDQFCKKASGSTVDNLNIDKVNTAIIPLPPLAEQKRIAGRIDELLAALPQ